MNNYIKALTLLLSSFALQASQNSQSQGVPPLVINEFMADPAGDISGDANNDGGRNSTEDEFVEIYNNSANPIDISGWTLSDSVEIRHTFPSGSIVEGNCAIVVFGGGNPAGAFGFSRVQTSSSSTLSLNNGGDSITLNSGPTTVSSHTYGSEGSNDQSLTRDPIATGLFIDHSTATGSNGSLFSPGTNPDGSNYSGCTIGDIPPRITSTTPSNLDSGVAVASNITLNFSEDVTIMPDAFDIDCDGTTIAWTVNSSTASSIVLDPSVDLPSGFCTVTAFASLITDLDDSIDPLDGNGDTTGGDDFIMSFIVDVPELEIWEIQGDSTASDYEGFEVSSKENIVTALDTLGFYMQTPDSRDDNNINTSNGIFVYINEDPAMVNPPISVGDEVDVEGPLIEFFELTEFSFADVTVVSSGNDLPTPVLLDDNFPPNDPVIAPCSTDLETHKYECFEGMHFNMPQGFISAGSAASNPLFPGADGDDVLVRAGSSRAFREPGVDFPGVNGFAVYDGNPEILEMDIDSLTLPLAKYAGGSEVAIKGIFGFDFGEYEIWPSEINVINENIVPGAVRDNSLAEATIASANLLRFFDDVDDPAPQDDDTILTTGEFNNKVSKLALYIVNDLKAPMILALQEVENINTLNALAAKILKDDAIAYTPYLTEANDPGGIDVAFMVRDNVTPVSAPVPLGTTETFISPTSGLPNTLHDRPPFYLQADIDLGGFSMRVNIIAIHNRSRGSIDNSNANEAARVRIKRFEQANSIAEMINTIQINNSGEAIIALGDFNAFDFSDGYADVIGQITGTAVEAENEYWQEPLFADSPLTQAVQTLPVTEQYSFVFRGSAQLLDNAILNDEALLLMNEIQFARGQSDVNFGYGEDASTSLRVSDHDGFVLYLSDDVIFMNGFE